MLVVLATLNWLRIPLTAFAFLGGAIAIGVGFGAQTQMNNFISGLILLAEQRIKVGDLIDVDGHLGRVVNLGTRCSRVRKFDGVDVLVPNSYLLEKNVVNWTLSDSHHRYDFVVGVAYGTPTELVMSTLTSALEAQSDVLKEPAAVVAFEAFGDNALTFHIYLTLGSFRRGPSLFATCLIPSRLYWFHGATSHSSMADVSIASHHPSCHL